MSTVRPPTHIALPPPPVWPDLQTDPPSPFAQFYTPPSSPAPSPNIFYTPPTSPFHDLTPPPPTSPARPVPPFNTTTPPPSAPALPPTDDHFPPAADITIDLAPDDADSLTTLEKIYLYSRSNASFHRVFIAHALPEYLLQVTPQEAVEYVQPLLQGLATDNDELVKEALAAEIVHVIWWFFTRCQIIPDDLKPEEAYASSSTTVTISVQAFTPILGTLLLSPNPVVGSAARYAVVELLSRIRKADDRELGTIRRDHSPYTSVELQYPWELAQPGRDATDDDAGTPPLVVGLFGRHERAMFTQEILQQVVIGMGRLDNYDAESTQSTSSPAPTESSAGSMEPDRSNPYFPPSHPVNHSPPTHVNFASISSPAVSPEALTPSRFPLPISPLQSPSPGTEFPPNTEAPVTRPSAAVHERRSPVPTGAHTTLLPLLPPQYPQMDANMDLDDILNDEEQEQAAAGRLSSMSLMAEITAKEDLQEATQRAFVKEVERIGRDPVYWVRREASFALGALAKVVPHEVVLQSLLPLFDVMRWDPVWHVRQSSLYALPPLLARLPSDLRRVVALETLTTLSMDERAEVRIGVLEALGETIYTFHGDPEGPPKQLIDLFLGRRQQHHVQNGQHYPMSANAFYVEPKRDVTCAYSFPAVALTLGRNRWTELRDPYLKLYENDSPGVRRTLAASLGAMAKIIGAEQAKVDLLSLWWSSMKSEDEDVRSRCIESITDFIGELGKEVGKVLLDGLLTMWNEGVFTGWRERGLIAQHMVSWVGFVGLDSASLGRAFLLKALEDSVAAVRETAISNLPDLYSFLSSTETHNDLLKDLQTLATSPMYRRRMTFIACQQALFLAEDKNKHPLILCDEELLRSIADLANDTIVGVRIGLSRFATLVHDNLLHHSHAIPSVLQDLIHQLSQDSSHEVRSYVAELSSGNAAGNSDTSLANSRRFRKRLNQLATFSRPPSAPSYPSSSSSNLAQELSIKPDVDRTLSGSSGQVDSIGSSVDGNIGYANATTSSSSSTMGSITAGSAPAESSNHFTEPLPNNLLAGVTEVYEHTFSDMKEQHTFEFQGEAGPPVLAVE